MVVMKWLLLWLWYVWLLLSVAVVVAAMGSHNIEAVVSKNGLLLLLVLSSCRGMGEETLLRLVALL